jgi:hypothetical protein
MNSVVAFYNKFQELAKQNSSKENLVKTQAEEIQKRNKRIAQLESELKGVS